MACFQPSVHQTNEQTECVPSRPILPCLSKFVESEIGIHGFNVGLTLNLNRRYAPCGFYYTTQKDGDKSYIAMSENGRCLVKHRRISILELRTKLTHLLN